MFGTNKHLKICPMNLKNEYSSLPHFNFNFLFPLFGLLIHKKGWSGVVFPTNTYSYAFCQVTQILRSATGAYLDRFHIHYATLRDATPIWNTFFLLIPAARHVNFNFQLKLIKAIQRTEPKILHSGADLHPRFLNWNLKVNTIYWSIQKRLMTCTYATALQLKVILILFSVVRPTLLCS